MHTITTVGILSGSEGVGSSPPVTDQPSFPSFGVRKCSPQSFANVWNRLALSKGIRAGSGLLHIHRVNSGPPALWVISCAVEQRGLRSLVSDSGSANMREVSLAMQVSRRMVEWTPSLFSIPLVARQEKYSLLARSRAVLHVRAQSHDTAQDTLPSHPVQLPVAVLQTPLLFLGYVLADRF